MLLENLKSDKIKYISKKCSENFIKFPLFMFFCRDINKRKNFIEDYFRYYLPEWSKNEIAFSNEDNSCIVSLVDPQKFEYKFKGINAHKLRKYEFSSVIFLYRENLETICDILLPYTKSARVMNIYSSANADFSQVESCIDEAIKYADENDTTILFDTFSKRYIAEMESKGFSVAYQKQFLGTQFAEIVMSYNM